MQGCRAPRAQTLTSLPHVSLPLPGPLEAYARAGECRHQPDLRGPCGGHGREEARAQLLSVRSGWRCGGCLLAGKEEGLGPEEGRRSPSSPPYSARQEKEAWIHAKYVEKKFLTKLPEIRGRRGGRGPPRGQPPLPPKPSVRPRPGSLRSRPGIALLGHLRRHLRARGPSLPLASVGGAQTTPAQVFFFYKARFSGHK